MEERMAGLLFLVLWFEMFCVFQRFYFYSKEFYFRFYFRCSKGCIMFTINQSCTIRCENNNMDNME